MARFTLALLTVSAALAQGPPNQSYSEIQRLEDSLRTNPGNATARSTLLDYYYLNKSVSPADAIAARRRHILWLIENAPASELAGTSPATITLRATISPTPKDTDSPRQPGGSR